MAVARQRVVAVELAEAAAEVDVLLARDVLVAEQQDAVVEEGTVDLVELGVAERLGEIDTLHLGAEGMAQRTKGKRHGDLFVGRATYHVLSLQWRAESPLHGLSANARLDRRVRRWNVGASTCRCLDGARCSSSHIPRVDRVLDRANDNFLHRNGRWP